MLDTLVRDCGLNRGWRVADIGSGTGLLTRLFLDYGCAVTGVEPNEEMRLAGEQILAHYPAFTSLPGNAETTGLPDESVDLVSAGMAFHWLDAQRTKVEFTRILSKAGWVDMVWIRLLTGPEPFMRDYTGLILQYSPGWTETLRRDAPECGLNLAAFFNGTFIRAIFPYQQGFDWQGLLGRTLSIGHAPQLNDPASAPLFSRLRQIFNNHQTNGQITLRYETEQYYGRVRRHEFF